jgi:pimeloyl-ACP methyl ester carboxylesterase
VHALGYDEPRLTRFARQLAREGYLVVTPDLIDLKDYDLAPSAVDDIEAAALHLLDGLGGASLAHRPAIMGVSFAGGLGLCAAGRPNLTHRLSGILVFGGYGNLDRVLAYLATGNLPEGGQLPPHLYGQAVVARRMANELVPAQEVEPLREALKLFLQERQTEFASAVPHLPPQAKVIASLCLNWDSKGMCERLYPIAAKVHTDARVSPEMNPRPDCPLYFLHGAEDNVIPPSESLALGKWAAQGGSSTALVTNLIRHVELEDKSSKLPPLTEAWKLIRLWTEFLRS